MSKLPFLIPDVRWRDMTLTQFLKSTSIRYDVAYPEEVVIEPEKELTEKQLFNNLKKELIKVRKM